MDLMSTMLKWNEPDTQEGDALHVWGRVLRPRLLKLHVSKKGFPSRPGPWLAPGK